MIPRLLSVRKKARVPATCWSKLGRGSEIEQVADGAVVARQPAGRPAVAADLDLETRRQLAIVRDPERLEPARRQQHRGIEDLHIDVVVGSGGSDLGLGGAAAFLELPFDPAAGDHEPRALGRGPRRAANAIERLGKRAGADPMHLGLVGQAGANGVDVGIDQTGNDGAAAEVDDARAGAGQRADCGRVPMPAILPSRTASAAAGAASWVTILPLTRIVSGACACAAVMPASAASRTRQRTSRPRTGASTAAAACNWSR